MTGIKDIRKKLGMSRDQLAAEMGVTAVTVGRWEGGSRTIQPDMAWRLVHLARARGMPRRDACLDVIYLEFDPVGGQP